MPAARQGETHWEGKQLCAKEMRISTKKVFLYRRAADSQIKAAVISSNICIFRPFIIVCFSNHVFTHTH